MHSKILHPSIITHFRATHLYGTELTDSVNGMSMVEYTNLMVIIAPNILETFNKIIKTL